MHIVSESNNYFFADFFVWGPIEPIGTRPLRLQLPTIWAAGRCEGRIRGKSMTPPQYKFIGYNCYDFAIEMFYYGLGEY